MIENRNNIENSKIRGNKTKTENSKHLKFFRCSRTSIQCMFKVKSVGRRKLDGKLKKKVEICMCPGRNLKQK